MVLVIVTKGIILRIFWDTQVIFLKKIGDNLIP